MLVLINGIEVTKDQIKEKFEAGKARIFHGANRVEFGFFGYGKGEEKRYTPETFGKRERQDMKDLAEFNKIQTTTHASVGVSGLSGLSQGRFDEQKRKESIDEVRRAVHFAAQATTGGAIVFHAAEAPRPIFRE